MYQVAAIAIGHWNNVTSSQVDQPPPPPKVVVVLFQGVVLDFLSLPAAAVTLWRLQHFVPGGSLLVQFGCSEKLICCDVNEADAGSASSAAVLSLLE